jgi:hypothetical protein
MHARCMSDKFEVGKVKGNPVPALAYSFRRAPSGSHGLTYPSDGGKAIYRTYDFTS